MEKWERYLKQTIGTKYKEPTQSKATLNRRKNREGVSMKQKPTAKEMGGEHGKQ
jgi:hypothetical protein